MATNHTVDRMGSGPGVVNVGLPLLEPRGHLTSALGGFTILIGPVEWSARGLALMPPEVYEGFLIPVVLFAVQGLRGAL